MDRVLQLFIKAFFFFLTCTLSIASKDNLFYHDHDGFNDGKHHIRSTLADDVRG